MSALYDVFADFFNHVSPEFRACLLGWIASISVTQPLKYAMPLAWKPGIRRTIAQVVAFAVALFAVHVMIPGDNGWVYGVIIGIWSPLAYAIAIKCLEDRFPWTADFLSADIRGVLIGEPRAAHGIDRRSIVLPPKDYPQ